MSYHSFDFEAIHVQGKLIDPFLISSFNLSSILLINVSLLHIIFACVNHPYHFLFPELLL
jgi:hypothetical protein